MDNGKYVRYTQEQVEALERLYNDCPKPSSNRRQQLIRDCPILSNIEAKQIKVWFQNRRCREKQRKESCRLQAVNRKLSTMNKLLMEENDRLQKQVSELVYENAFFRQQSQNLSLVATTDTSSESVVSRGQHAPCNCSAAGLMSIAEDTLSEFLSKATGTAVEWVQMPGMKPGPDFVGSVAISHGCSGVAARACGLVGLEPTRVAEILKDKTSWLHDCRSVQILKAIPTASCGSIELLYMQMYAPTTLAPARDFCLLRYTSFLDDGSLVICERSLKNTQSFPSASHSHPFVRSEIFPSGYLIRPCEGGGSIIHVVDHMDLEPWSVPEVLRRLYSSSTWVAQKITITALCHLRKIVQENSQQSIQEWGRRPSAVRALSQRLSRGYNEAVNGFTDDGWSLVESDGIDDVTVLVKCSSNAVKTVNLSPSNIKPSLGTAVICAKASLLLQDIHPPVLLRFLRENRSSWTDGNVDAFTAAAELNSSGQAILPLEDPIDNEELLEVIKLEKMWYKEDTVVPTDVFLLQLCRGIEETTCCACSELIFAPIDPSFSNEAPIVPSGFRIIPVDAKPESSSRTLDLASALEIGSTKARGDEKCVMTIAFQFAFETELQDNMASLARQYVRSIIGSVQRVSATLSGCRTGYLARSLEASTLTRWICRSYKWYVGAELLISEDRVKSLWQHPDAVVCWSLKASKQLKFANQAGLDMLETSAAALEGISVDDIFDESGGRTMCSEIPQALEQGFMWFQGGLCLSTMRRPVSYQKAVAWKVLDDEDNPHCISFMFVNWSFL